MTDEVLAALLMARQPSHRDDGRRHPLYPLRTLVAPMTCIARPPVTLDEWLAVIDNCAVAYGGAAWPQLALTGLLALALGALAVLLLAGFVRLAR